MLELMLQVMDKGKKNLQFLKSLEQKRNFKISEML